MFKPRGLLWRREDVEDRFEAICTRSRSSGGDYAERRLGAREEMTIHGLQVWSLDGVEEEEEEEEVSER